MLPAFTLELCWTNHTKHAIPIDRDVSCKTTMNINRSKTAVRNGSVRWMVIYLVRAERSQGDRRRTAIREAKKIEREAVADGKKPYYLKGSEKKRLSLEQRYECMALLNA